MEDIQIKELILTRASERFVRDGISRVSVDDIASDLGMSKKTLYKHFESKDELITLVARRLMVETRGAIEGIVQTEGSFLQKLDGFMTYIASRLATLSKPFIADIRHCQPELWNELQAFRRQRMVENFQRLLSDGIKQGYVRADLNQQIFILSFLSAIENVITPVILTEQSFSASEAIRGILRIFFQGIMTEEASKEFRTIQEHHLSS